MAMVFCQLSCHFSAILTVSVCAEQNLIYFVLFPCFFYLNFVTSVHVNPFFYIFPSTCHWGFSQDIQWLLSVDFQSTSRSKTYGSGEE